MVNRYTQFRPYEFDLYKPDVNTLNATLSILQKRFDTNKLEADKLKNQMIDALPQDRQRANELQQKYSAEIDNIVAGYKGDYSKATTALYEIQSKMAKDFGKGGEAGAIQTNFDSYMEWNKRQQARLAKKEIIAEDYDLAKRKFLGDFGGTSTQDEYGNYADINNNLEEVAEYVNPNDVIKPIFDTIKPSSYKKQRTIFKNGLQIDVTEARKGVDEERLSSAFSQGLKGDARLVAYMDQKMRLYGLDPKQTNPWLESYAKQRGKELAYDEVEDLQKADRDPLAIAKYNQDRQDRRQKDEQSFQQRFQFDPTINNTNPYKPIEDGLLNKTYSFWDNPFFGSGQGYNRAAADKAVSDAKTNGKTLEEVLSDPELVQEKGIMPQLLQEFMRDNIESLNPNIDKAYDIYSAKYGTDKEWTRNFDLNVIKQYNADIKNHSRVQPVSMNVPYDKGGKELVTQVYSALRNNPSQVEVFEVGTNKFMRADEAGFTGDELLMDKTSSANGTQVTQDVRYVVPQPFIPQGGLAASKNGKQYVIVDQDEYMHKSNEAIGKAFSSIYEGGDMIGTPFKVSEGNGSPVYARPQLTLIKSGKGRIQKMSYPLYSNGQPLTDAKGNPQVWEPESITDLFANMDYLNSRFQTKKK